MKKWIVRISLICWLAASLVTLIGVQPRLFDPDLTVTVFSRINQALFYILVLLSIALAGLILAAFLGEKIFNLVIRSPGTRSCIGE